MAGLTDYNTFQHGWMAEFPRWVSAREGRLEKILQSKDIFMILSSTSSLFRLLDWRTFFFLHWLSDVLCAAGLFTIHLFSYWQILHSVAARPPTPVCIPWVVVIYQARPTEMLFYHLPPPLLFWHCVRNMAELRNGRSVCPVLLQHTGDEQWHLGALQHTFSEGLAAVAYETARTSHFKEVAPMSGYAR